MNDLSTTGRILVATPVYPSREQPHAGTFVKRLVEHLAAMRPGVDVVHPRSRWKLPQATENPDVHEMPGSSNITVHRPLYTSFSALSLLNGVSTYRLTCKRFAAAVWRTVRTLPHPPALAYGHFLYPAGYAAVRVGRKRSMPAVAALGESNMDFYARHLGLRQIRRDANRLSALISVSKRNRDIAASVWQVPDARVHVLPNAPDTDLFFPRDRQAIRDKLGLPPERFLVLFAGHLNERKGPLRVARALQTIPEAGGLFLGEGTQRPDGDSVLHCGPVAHEEVPLWMAAADLFVLPTRAEGCPNVLGEAMACGLPVITSDIPEIRAFVPKQAALLIPPDDIPSLASAIRTLMKNSARRHAMSLAAVEYANTWNLHLRSRQLLQILQEIL